MRSTLIGKPYSDVSHLSVVKILSRYTSKRKNIFLLFLSLIKILLVQTKGVCLIHEPQI